MSDSRLPSNVTDQARLSAIAKLGIRAQTEGDEFSTMARLGAGILDCPIGLVTLLLSDKQIFLGTFGTEIRETPIEEAFCAFTIAADEATMVVLDAQNDLRFADFPLVRNSPNIRFYAGASVVVDGQKVGTVCVLDSKPRSAPDTAQIDQLKRLALLASSLLETKHHAQQKHENDQARRRAEFRHSLALRAATITSWMWNIKSNMVETDDALREWVDLSISDAISMQDILTFVHPDDVENVRVALDMALEEDGDFRCEFRLKSSDMWLMGQGRVYERDADGHALSMAGVFVDITETKRTEQTTRLLLRELNHRVKNTLAMLQSLAAQTLKTTPQPDQFLRAFSGRLQALAAVHTLLSDNEWHKVSVHTLLRAMITPYAPRSEANIEIAGSDVPIGPDEGLGLGLVIHELATNAARHGALSNQTGKVEISTHVTQSSGPDVLNIEWRETGVSPAATGQSKGLGSMLIERGMQKILKSSVKTEFGADGVTASITFPLPQDSK